MIIAELLNLEGFKGYQKFLVSLVVIVTLGLISLSVLILFFMQRVVFADVSNIVSPCIIAIGSIGGAFLGIQGWNDHHRITVNSQNTTQGGSNGNEQNGAANSGSSSAVK